jgi:hypothetical protein
MDKRPSLLGPFLSYKETKELRIQLIGPYSQQFIFFKTYTILVWKELPRTNTLAFWP